MHKRDLNADMARLSKDQRDKDLSDELLLSECGVQTRKKLSNAGRLGLELRYGVTFVESNIAKEWLTRAIQAEAELKKYKELELTPEDIADMVTRFASFLCEITGGRMSKTNYTLKDMVAVADDYHQRICDDSLQEEIERANKAEALNRELVEAINDLLCEYEDLILRLPCSTPGGQPIHYDSQSAKRAEDTVTKVKEELGDGN